MPDFQFYVCLCLVEKPQRFTVLIRCLCWNRKHTESDQTLSWFHLWTAWMCVFSEPDVTFDVKHIVHVVLIYDPSLSIALTSSSSRPGADGIRICMRKIHVCVYVHALQDSEENADLKGHRPETGFIFNN